MTGRKLCFIQYFHKDSYLNHLEIFFENWHIELGEFDAEYLGFQIITVKSLKVLSTDLGLFSWLYYFLWLLLTECSSMDINISLVIFLRENMFIPFSLNSIRKVLLKIAVWTFYLPQMATIAFKIWRNLLY